MYTKNSDVPISRWNRVFQESYSCLKRRRKHKANKEIRNNNNGFSTNQWKLFCCTRIRCSEKNLCTCTQWFNVLHFADEYNKSKNSSPALLDFSMIFTVNDINDIYLQVHVMCAERLQIFVLFDWCFYVHKCAVIFHVFSLNKYANNWSDYVLLNLKSKVLQT